MPTSRKRGGKKAHRKRVLNRSKRIQDEKNRYNKYQKEAFEKLLQQYEEQAKKEESGIPDVNQIEGLDGPEL
jgi:thymidylate kinase